MRIIKNINVESSVEIKKSITDRQPKDVKTFHHMQKVKSKNVNNKKINTQ
jgi:hypothetical protein